MNEWLRNNLVCPRDGMLLETNGNTLICSKNHSYPVFDGIPVMLVEEEESTHGYISETLTKVSGSDTSAQAVDGFDMPIPQEGEVDAFVQKEIPLTCGFLYIPLMDKLKRYPIPNLRLPNGEGKRLLDVGCNWGRWTVAASQKGYQVIGMDVSLKSVLAARRICRQINVEADFVVGDARFLPFQSNSFDVGFSYSVLQHFAKEAARTSLKEIGRVVKTEGKILVQMANKYGVRSFYHQARRGFHEGGINDVRYWSPADLQKTFEQTFGQTKMTVDCFFGLNVQANDVDLLPAHYKAVVYSSEALRRASDKLKFLRNVADSVYLESVNQKQSYQKI